MATDRAGRGGSPRTVDRNCSPPCHVRAGRRTSGPIGRPWFRGTVPAGCLGTSRLLAPCSTEALAPCSMFRLVLAEPVGLRSSEDKPRGQSFG